ncbi:MAG TPA: 5'/3'-nucleotidase SurE, partial [Anaerolineales bacterium]|nr:5'/3'-nucleotidase SurE [Anaerolineales bacterium]
MHILVTNDDGVQAPGLLSLSQAMRPLGKVTVFAPDRNWSASGHVKTLDRPLRVRETTLIDGYP